MQLQETEKNVSHKNIINKKKYNKVLVIGSGPIIIGQAAEFDYSGSQCLQVLKEHKIYSIIVNSNPATIMTDESMADKVYMEPLTIEFLKKILIIERPDGIMGSFGGQTALNLCKNLAESGFLNTHHIDLLGSSLETIQLAEDRQLFRGVMQKCGFPVPKSSIVHQLEEGKQFAQELGYPVVIRPAFTLGGSGGGIAYNEAEMLQILAKGLHFSPVHQCLMEQSILGYKEIEFEVVRDHAGNAITVCSMENIDPVGIHTGDSIVVAPILTLTDKEFQMLRTASLNIAHHLNIIGGCNVQLAIDPKSSNYFVIEVNPRVSRSSALASKATGYPIAKVAAEICLGKNLSDIKNPITQKTFATHEPALDYIIVKIPRWPFDKFVSANRKLGTQMKATGEVMSIGRSFEEALLKAIRSLEIDRDDLFSTTWHTLTNPELLAQIGAATDERLWQIAEAFRRGLSLEEVYSASFIDLFFLTKIKNLVHAEKNMNADFSISNLAKWKKLGFTNSTIAFFSNKKSSEISNMLAQHHIKPVVKTVDTCAGEFVATTPYYYLTYEQEDEFVPTNEKSVVILGSGPIRIGQGIEFDYASVHALNACKAMGYQTIMINNNPETCSTDFSFSDRLYFEPLHIENVLQILAKEQPTGVLVQFGGQTAINLAKQIAQAGYKIFGTSADDIDRVENRQLFEAGLEKLSIKRPKGITVGSQLQWNEVRDKLQYPVIVRPSFVLGGRNMSVCYNQHDVDIVIKKIAKFSDAEPILIDEYIKGKEIEVDVLSDGEKIYIPGIMEHIERAGIHSGDSIAVYPTYKLLPALKTSIIEISELLSREFNLVGIFNMQLTVKKGELYLLEVNPRASRTVPFISKMIGQPVAQMATLLALGQKISALNLVGKIAKEPKWFSVKVPVFSFEKLPDLDPVLEAEMKSTGEVLGRDQTFEKALYKGLLAQGLKIPTSGKLLATISDRYKEEALPLIEQFYNLGFEILATKGTAEFLQKNANITATLVYRISEKDHHPQIDELIKNHQVQFIVNTLSKGKESNQDGFLIRSLAAERGIPCFTSLDTVEAVLKILQYLSFPVFHEDRTHS